jgi:hypothetical protein
MPTTPETPDIVQTVKQGYAFEGPAIELGARLVDGTPNPAAAVRIPLSMVNRHGPRRGCYRYLQDQDAPVDGRAAVRRRCRGVRS